MFFSRHHFLSHFVFQFLKQPIPKFIFTPAIKNLFVDIQNLTL